MNYYFFLDVQSKVKSSRSPQNQIKRVVEPMPYSEDKVFFLIAPVIGFPASPHECEENKQFDHGIKSRLSPTNPFIFIVIS